MSNQTGTAPTVEQQRMVRCCATCADWLSGKMECRYVEGEPAPPEAVCEGWIRRRERLPHWDKWAKDKAPNAGTQRPGSPDGLQPKRESRVR